MFPDDAVRRYIGVKSAWAQSRGRRGESGGAESSEARLTFYTLGCELALFMFPIRFLS